MGCRFVALWAYETADAAVSCFAIVFMRLLSAEGLSVARKSACYRLFV
jgi:hypothetical protein